MILNTQIIHYFTRGCGICMQNIPNSSPATSTLNPVHPNPLQIRQWPKLRNRILFLKKRFNFLTKTIKRHLTSNHRLIYKTEGTRNFTWSPKHGQYLDGGQESLERSPAQPGTKPERNQSLNPPGIEPSDHQPRRLHYSHPVGELINQSNKLLQGNHKTGELARFL